MAINFNNGFPGKTSGEVSAGGVGSFEVGTLASGTNGFTKAVTSTATVGYIDGILIASPHILSTSVSPGTYLITFRVTFGMSVSTTEDDIKFWLNVGGTRVGPKYRLGGCQVLDNSPTVNIYGFCKQSQTVTVPLVVTASTSIAVAWEVIGTQISYSPPVDDYHTMSVIRIA